MGEKTGTQPMFMWMKFGLMCFWLLMTTGVAAQDPVDVAGLEEISVDNANDIQQVGMHGYGAVDDIAWSPDGKIVAVAGSLGLIFYDAKLFEQAPAERWQLPEATVYAVAYSPDGSMIATVSGDLLPPPNSEYVFRLWDASTGTVYTKWTNVSWRDPDIMFSPDGTELAVAYDWNADSVAHWNVSHPSEVIDLESETWVEVQRRWYAPDSIPTIFQFELIYSPNGSVAAYIAGDVIIVLDTHTHERLYSIESDTYFGFGQLFITPNSQMLVSIAWSEAGGGIIQAWDIATGELLLESDRGGIDALGFHPNQSAIMFKTFYGTDVHFWQTGMEDSETVLGQYALWQPNQFTNIDFNNDGSVLAAVHGGVVEFWDVDKGVKVQDDLIIPYSEGVGKPTIYSRIEFSPNGQMLAAVADDASGQSDDEYVYLMNAHTLEVLGRISYEHHLLDLAFSPDGSLFATYHSVYDGDVAPNAAYLWDIATVLENQTTTQMAATIWNFNLGPTLSSDLAFSPDGSLLALTGRGIELWDVSAILNAEQGEALGLTFEDDLDGTALVAKYDGTGPLAFSPSGDLLVSLGRQDGCYLTVRDVQSGGTTACLGEDISKDNAPGAIVFVDEGLLISGAEIPYGNRDLLSTDLRLWDVDSGSLLAVLEGHFEEFNDIAVSPTGRLIVSAGGGHITCSECPSFDGSLRIWGISSDE